MTGTVISEKYRLLERIGTGGMAEVYKAVQLTAPHRTVAIKFLKSEYAGDAAFLRRFDTEANTVLVLSHDNIVRSYDVGEDDGRHYIVLEYVEGQTLKEAIQKQNKLPLRTLVNVGAQVLDALSHAHERGIIHRDVKPQNIIINHRGRAKLADFGIARAAATSDTVTYAGNSMLGSVHYFSPEQAKGKSATVESDLYSMGVTLYEMATGSVPFTGETSVSIAVKHLQEEPIAPIALNPALPTALNDIILKAMQKRPGNRYHTAKEMRRDLLRVLREPDGDFAKLQMEGVPVTRKKKKRGRRGIVRIAAITFFAVAVLVAVMLMGQSILSTIRGGDTGALAPTLLGKTVEEAEKLAQLRGYTIMEVGRVASQEYESGLIVAQLPVAGTELAEGSAIQVTISLGSGELTYMPDLIGKTLAEAELLLNEVGLHVGTVDYRTSELPAGQVFRQVPDAESELLRGDEVDLYVSGAPTRTLEAPDVLQQPLETALRLFTERGFTRFRVERGEPHEVEDIVIRQHPTQGETASASGVVTLVVTVAGQPAYGTSLPITMDVTKPETELIITMERTLGEIRYELVLYKNTLTEGRQELVADLRCEEEGRQELIIYMDGTETMRLPAGMAPIPAEQQEGEAEQ